MKTYARMQNDVVAELLSTSGDITTMFIPSLTWVEVTGNLVVQPGWVRQPSGAFTPPPNVPPPPGASVAVATTAALQAQLAALQLQLSALISASR